MNERHTILVAEDDLGFRVLIMDYLHDEGFRVILAEDAAGVLQHGPDVDALVVDVRLPTGRLEGIEAVANLISDGKLSSETPVVFISVHTETDDPCRRKLYEMSIPKERYSWLQKPFELERLVGVIRGKFAVRDC